MSEMEISTFRQRSQEAIRQMARRGEFYTRIAEGYQQREDGSLEMDADEQVRHTLQMVFSKFRELGSARQVFVWFHQEDIKLPSRLSPKAATVDWSRATPWMITRILKDPVYAGVYAFGRTKRRVIVEEGQKRVLKLRRWRPEEWEVFLPDHHEAYISWQEFVKNQETLAHNRNQRGEAVQGSARKGERAAGRIDPLRALWPQVSRTLQWPSHAAKRSGVLLLRCLSEWSERQATVQLVWRRER
jgi:hypothetical protein